MAKGQYKCSKCGRAFSMPAHLARHMNAGHGMGGGRSQSSVKRGPGRPAKASAASFSGGNAGQIMGDIQAYLSSLTSQRDEIEAQIAAMNSALSVLGGAPTAARSTGARRGRPPKMSRAGGGGGRRPEGGSLKDFVLKVLRQSHSPLGVKDLSLAVKRAGYQTASKDLSKAISNLLPQVKEIRKVDRGLYKL